MPGEPPDRGRDGGGRGAKSKTAGRGGNVGMSGVLPVRNVNSSATNETESLTEQLRIIRMEMKAIRAELETNKKLSESPQQSAMPSSQPSASGTSIAQPGSGDAGKGQPKSSDGRVHNEKQVGRNRQSYKPFDISQSRRECFTKYHVIEVEEGRKRKLNPFRAFDDIKFHIKGEPEDFSSIGKDKFLVTVKSKQQSEDLKKLRALDSVPCNVVAHKNMNYSKGLIYVREFDIGEEDLKAGLADQYVTEVKSATWIKTKSESVKPFLITFAVDSIPEYIRIPGESFRTVVYEYVQRPMQCRKCQQYGHTMKWCTSEVAVCGKCATSGHSTADCQATEAKCIHCEEGHYAWNRKCRENLFQTEVTKTQSKEKISRRDAIAVVTRRYPNRKTPFSGITRERREPPVQRASTSEQSAVRPKDNPVAQKRKIVQVSSPSSKGNVSRDNVDLNRGKKRREDTSSVASTDMSVEESDSEEDVLRQIYDNYVPENSNHTSTKDRRDNAVMSNHSKVKPYDLSVGMITINKEATRRTDQVINELEKYKVARLYFVPSEQEYTHALIMSSDPLPEVVEILDGKLKLKVTLIDNFSAEQEAELRRIIKS